MYPMNTSSDRASAERLGDAGEFPREAPDLFGFLQPVDEALDVAFLAIRSAQQAARDVPASAPAAKFREEWHTSNVLVRQALRLVDERVQELARTVRRLPRLG